MKKQEKCIFSHKKLSNNKDGNDGWCYKIPCNLLGNEYSIERVEILNRNDAGCNANPSCRKFPFSNLDISLDVLRFISTANVIMRQTLI